jgi:hypothetical protein
MLSVVVLLTKQLDHDVKVVVNWNVSVDYCNAKKKIVSVR